MRYDTIKPIISKAWTDSSTGKRCPRKTKYPGAEHLWRRSMLLSWLRDRATNNARYPNAQNKPKVEFSCHFSTGKRKQLVEEGEKID
ncbi:hypothetical protein TNIN_462821 [Trichonephila inaurata madagascariensis]|uniref:Uncharacterized protein n=1 Tax=Trichonephila inaurata madagascariensis TaxID=2747483 RepID=A0A8X6XSK6_9ARAC|nr:hypothetical protein TNIN_462821 [Trichonephila inaurata madagascariensis]